MNAPALSQIRKELSEIAATADLSLRSVVEYGVAGGKCYRAQLVLDVGRDLRCEAGNVFGEGSPLPNASLIRVAALLELLHAATLLQDDLFDGSRMRRGRPAAWLRFSPQLATLAADWMLAEAIRLAFGVNPRFGDALCRCAQQLISGEAREASPVTPRTRVSLAEHAHTIARAKTGSLFALALSAPALLADRPELALELASAGSSLGLAFQYLDDVIDLIGDPEVAGKEVGRDQALQLITLPLLEQWALLPLPVQEAILAKRAISPFVLGSALANPRVRRRLIDSAQRQWSSAVDRMARLLPSGALLTAHLRHTCDALLAGAGEEIPAETAA